MANDVDEALHEVVERGGDLNEKRNRSIQIAINPALLRSY